MGEHVFVLRDIDQTGPARLTGEQLADEIRVLAAHIDAAKARWLALVAEFERRKLWAEWGARSCAEWVAWQCGLAPGAAREHVRVATRLEELPVVGDAFARGELSYSKVRALTRLEGVEDEEEVVELARAHTASQLDRVVAATRRVARPEAATINDGRYLRFNEREDGSVDVRGRLAGEEAAVLRRALDSAATVMREAEGDDEARWADALVLLADTLLSCGPRPRSAPERHEVVVHVDADALAAAEEPTASVSTDRGEPLAVDVARRLCCDAGIVVSLERGGEPLAVGRRKRTIPPAIRRALSARDRTCRFPGCDARLWLDAHHVQHWADGGDTSLDNLVLLCHHHHKHVHEGGYRIELEDGRSGSVVTLVDDHRRTGVDPCPGTASALQTGQRLDRDLSVQAFLGHVASTPWTDSACLPSGRPTNGRS